MLLKQMTKWSKLSTQILYNLLKLLKLTDQTNVPWIIRCTIFFVNLRSFRKSCFFQLLWKLISCSKKHDLKLIYFESFSDRMLGRRTFFTIQVLFLLEILTYMKIFRSTLAARTTSAIDNKDTSMTLIILKHFMTTSSVSILVLFRFLKYKCLLCRTENFNSQLWQDFFLL